MVSNKKPDSKPNPSPKSNVKSNVKNKNSIKEHKNRKKHYKKRHLPKKIREQIWINYYGTNYSGKCFVPWCSNQIDVFNYQVGHNVPESKGGSSNIDNLRPLCANCNMSMGNQYTIDEWNNIVPKSDVPTHTLIEKIWKRITTIIEWR